MPKKPSPKGNILTADISVTMPDGGVESATFAFYVPIDYTDALPGECDKSRFLSYLCQHGNELAGRLFGELPRLRLVCEDPEEEI